MALGSASLKGHPSQLHLYVSVRVCEYFLACARAWLVPIGCVGERNQCMRAMCELRLVCILTDAQPLVSECLQPGEVAVRAIKSVATARVSTR